MKIVDFFTAKPARFFLLAALLWLGLMCFLNSKDLGENGFSWHDILVEANGMFFDLLVFGILLSLYEALREKRERVERLKEEIDDYREWKEPEAMHRIVGITKRLSKLKVQNLNLSRCFLPGANFEGLHLRSANLTSANLESANISSAILHNADLSGANLRSANLNSIGLIAAQLCEANLSNSYLRYSNLRGANFRGANLELANLEGAMVEGADFTGTWFDLAIVGENWFEKLEDGNVIGREKIINDFFINDGILQQRISS